MVVKLDVSDPWIQSKEEQLDNMRNLNRTAARITLNGKRHYTTPLPTGPAPSVTTIISETASEANKRKLEMWSKANPGVKEAAAERGTAVHFGMEQYLKGNKTPDISDEYKDFWAGMPAILDQFSEVLWAESPVKDEYKFTLGADDVARVWGCDDEGRAWAGAPDIIAVANNKLTLADLKTSVKPYSRKWPKDYEKGSQEWRDLLGGYMKFKKTCKQLAAYDIAIEQTLGIKVSQAAILVSTPVRTQVFKISRRFLNSLREDWFKIVAEYYKQIDNCNVYDPDLI
jgi:hypothetical protein|tara:strand:- start:2156 stop:3010 length:855 start_codon:yes stop_codon:yes gene_type:complete